MYAVRQSMRFSSRFGWGVCSYLVYRVTVRGKRLIGSGFDSAVSISTPRGAGSPQPETQARARVASNQAPFDCRAVANVRGPRRR